MSPEEIAALITEDIHIDNGNGNTTIARPKYTKKVDIDHLTKLFEESMQRTQQRNWERTVPNYIPIKKHPPFVPYEYPPQQTWPSIPKPIITMPWQHPITEDRSGQPRRRIEVKPPPPPSKVESAPVEKPKPRRQIDLD